MEAHGDTSMVGRRSLIKGAAVAGFAAWTAPVILDSIASPAAAVSGIKRYQLIAGNTGSSASCAAVPTAPSTCNSSAGTNVSTGWATAANGACASLTVSGGQTTITVSSTTLTLLGVCVESTAGTPTITGTFPVAPNGTLSLAKGTSSKLVNVYLLAQ